MYFKLTISNGNQFNFIAKDKLDCQRKFYKKYGIDVDLSDIEVVSQNESKLLKKHQWNLGDAFAHEQSISSYEKD
jgi:hypothetical protein